MIGGRYFAKTDSAGSSGCHSSSVTAIPSVSDSFPSFTILPGGSTNVSTNPSSIGTIQVNTSNISLDHTLYCLTKIEQETSSAEMLVYPNPSSGSFTISFAAGSSRNVTASVFNMLGEVVLNAELERAENTIAVSGLDTGMYLLKLEDEKGIIALRKIVVSQP